MSANRQVLDPAVARRIARTWSSTLETYVDLANTREDYNVFGRGYGWISFKIDWTSRAQVSAARAAALTWFALSCCPGYAGRENPAFWKELFGSTKRAFTVVDISSVNEAYDIIDGPGVEFPRFQLWMYEFHTNVRRFCGVAGEASLEAGDATTLQQILTSLAPYIDPKRAARRPVVHLTDVAADHLTDDRDGHAHGLAKLLTDAKDAKYIQTWPATTFSIENLAFRYEGVSLQRVVADFDGFRQRLLDYSLTVKSFDCVDAGKVNRHALADIAMRVVCGDGARFTTLRLSLDDLDAIPAFASVLPRTRAIHCVHLNYAQHQDKFDRSGCVWLAYALYHPDTPSSTWRSLYLEATSIREDAVAVLRAMARGNNLAAQLDGREAPSDGYYQGTVVASTHVFDQPRSDSLVLQTSDGSLTVDVCDVVTDDSTRWAAWVAVIVPGYGLGYVRAEDVTSVHKRTPSWPSLTTFCTTGPHGGLPTFLQLVGGSLETLNITGVLPWESTEGLKEALSHCPLLETLSLPCSGELWTDHECHNLLPRLRELQLFLGDDELALMLVPRSLRVLRIDRGTSRRSYTEAVRHILSHPSNLRLFHCLCSPERDTFRESIGDSQKRIEQLGLSANEWAATSASRLGSASAVAFLSVLGHHGTKATIARLSDELVRSVIAFARGQRVIVCRSLY